MIEVKKEDKPEFLRKKGTEEKFIYTDALMARGDMVAYFPDGDNGKDEDHLDPNKLQLVAEAIAKLPKGKGPRGGFTVTGLPKTKLLSEIMDTEVTPAERDEAFELFKIASN